MTQLIVLNCKRLAPNGSIEGVGGINQSTSAQQHFTETEAIAAIDAGRFRFEVHGISGQIACVRVNHHGSHRFLETHRDGTKTDNLGELHLCHHSTVVAPPPYRPAPIQHGHCVHNKHSEATK